MQALVSHRAEGWGFNVSVAEETTSWDKMEHIPEENACAKDWLHFFNNQRINKKSNIYKK